MKLDKVEKFNDGTRADFYRGRFWSNRQESGGDPSMMLEAMAILFLEEWREMDDEMIVDFIRKPFHEGGLESSLEEIKKYVALSHRAENDSNKSYYDPKIVDTMSSLRQRVNGITIAISMPGGDRKSEDFDQDQGYNITLNRGSNEAYIKARLKRDNPDLLIDVLNGNISARKAGIKAGFVKPSFTISGVNMESAARTISKKLTPDQVGELIVFLNNFLHP